MAFNGTEGRSIEQVTAAAWTRAYRELNLGEVQSHFFGRDILELILKQGGCQGIRLYYARNGTGPQLLAVGAGADESDQLDGTHLVADETRSGPPHSGQANVLNS